MGLFDNDDVLEDDDYVVNTDIVDEEEEELGSDSHISAQPKPKGSDFNKLHGVAQASKKVTKKLPAKLRAKGIVSMHIVKQNGREITFI